MAKLSVVIDSSADVALLCSASDDGAWVATQCAGALLLAPSLVGYEVANVLRRLAMNGDLDSSEASMAMADFGELAIRTWPFRALAARSWELQHNFTMYNASYIALAERVDAPLVTLDRRLSNAPGGTCEFRTPM